MREAVFCLLMSALACAIAFAQTPQIHDPVINPAVGTQRPSIKDEPSAPQPIRDRARELAKLKLDAQTLAELAKTIPAGVDQAQKGILPTDLLANLKRIEKLSHSIRSQLSR